MRLSYAKLLELLEARRVKRLVVYGDMNTAVAEVRPQRVHISLAVQLHTHDGFSCHVHVAHVWYGLLQCKIKPHSECTLDGGGETFDCIALWLQLTSVFAPEIASSAIAAACFILTNVLHASYET